MASCHEKWQTGFPLYLFFKQGFALILTKVRIECVVSVK